MKDTLKLVIIAVIGFAALSAAYIIGQNKLPNLRYCNAQYQMDEKFHPSTWQPVGWDMSDYPRTDCEMAPDKIVHQDGTWEWK
jgi:hypothetical protein